MSPLLSLAFAVIVAGQESSLKKCVQTATKASGLLAPKHFCSGDIIFSEDFNYFDLEKWQHENTLAGGGNNEFQWYTNNRSNSFTQDGNLHIRPNLMSDQIGEDGLASKTLNVDGGDPASGCTNPKFSGCQRTGTPTNILNPIKSARIRTTESFRFVYGKVEVRAKMPAGDWLWPAIWLLPSHNVYGRWPSSGEIDLVESRGNRHLEYRGSDSGVVQVSSTLNFGPYLGLNGWEKAYWTKKNQSAGFDVDFHRYQLEWTPEFIRFSIDDEVIGRLQPTEGLFKYGGFGDERQIDNPWKNGTKMAPFDEKFYLIIELAVGGTTFFADSAINPKPKPWLNNSTQAATDFWNGRADWLPTWNLGVSDDADLQVDYVRIWAL